MLTATDTVIRGGGTTACRLPRPGAPHSRDVAVLAFPFRREAWEDSRSLPFSVGSSVPGWDAGALFRKADRLLEVPGSQGGAEVTVTIDFGREFTARSLAYETRPRGKATTSATNVPGPPSDTFTGTGYSVLPDLGQLEVSDDGVSYSRVCGIAPVYRAHSSWRRKTVSFPAATGRHFRLRLRGWAVDGDGAEPLQLGNVVLSGRASVDRWEEKAALFSEYVEGDRTPDYPPEETIPLRQVVDLTGLVDSAGTLRWDAPPGDWVVMRFAHVPTGARTKHGRKNLMGLECDRMSAEAARVQWDNYFRPIADSVEAHGGRLAGMAMDSHEGGSQNWTPGFEAEFERLRGYDPRKLLPAMAGCVVESREVSDRFLYDVRRTVADLVADRHYGTFESLCRERGIDLTAQAAGNALCLVADQIQAKGRVGKPQGEFWAIHPDGNYDIKESSSAAHMYGRQVASGEAFTDATYGHSLAYLKRLADCAYCFGLNEFVVCASAYQPWLDRVPGNTAGGRQYCLNRNNTLWPHSAGFWDWQARCSFLLRQGRPVVDLCVYLGDNAPVKILSHRLPEIPPGYDFDAFTTDALLTRMDAVDGRIVLPDGMRYRMMVLPGNGEVTLAALRRIASLVERGVPVYGPRPVGSGSLSDFASAGEYDGLVEAMWGEGNVPAGSHRYGKGTVYWGMGLGEAVREAGLVPDVALSMDGTLGHAHRALEDGDVYFLYNHSDGPMEGTVTFRCCGKSVELWDPVTGRRWAMPHSTAPDGWTVVPLRMAPRESFFVAIADRGTGRLPAREAGAVEVSVPIQGDWTVEFPEVDGGAGTLVFKELSDWTAHPDERVRHYSGTATYRHALSLDRPSGGERILLRLGGVGSVADVTLNGKDLGTVWCSPWEVDLTPCVVQGDNVLEIRVTNSLVNRMVGDSMLSEDRRTTHSTTPIATPNDSLVPSGLVGPVCLVRVGD